MKNLVVIIDDFGSASHWYLDAGLLDIYDFAVVTTNTYADDYSGLPPLYVDSLLTYEYRLLYGTMPDGSLISQIDGDPIDGDFYNDPWGTPEYVTSSGYLTYYNVETSGPIFRTFPVLGCMG